MPGSPQDNREGKFHPPHVPSPSGKSFRPYGCMLMPEMRIPHIPGKLFKRLGAAKVPSAWELTLACETEAGMASDLSPWRPVWALPPPFCPTGLLER